MKKFRLATPVPKEKLKEVMKELAQKCNSCAFIWDKDLKDKEIMFLAEGKVYSVMFEKKNFIHLCGLEAGSRPWEFYNKAVKGKLNAGFIRSSKRHPISTAYSKTNTLPYILKALTYGKADALYILESLSTKTRDHYDFCFYIESNEYPGTMGFVKEEHGKYVPATVRTRAKDTEEYVSEKCVDYILTKDKNAKKYSKAIMGNIAELENYIEYYGINKDKFDINKIKTSKRTKLEIIKNETAAFIDEIIEEDELNEDYEMDI